ncbi:MAG: IPT/TIG domain-containing protein [Myxococcota bacterium]
MLTGLLSAACPGPVVQGPATQDDYEPVLRLDAGPVVTVPDEESPDDDGGLPEEDAGVVDTGAVGVLSVTAPNGPLVGGNRVAIEGYGFTPGLAEGGDTRVYFGPHEATGVLYQSENRLTAFVPPGDEPGVIDVRVENSLGVGVGEAVYTYFSPVRLVEVTPASGSTKGGEAIALSGEGFTSGMRVVLGGRQVPSLVVTSENTATAYTPPSAPGRVDVAAFDAFGESALELGFRYVSPLSLDEVSPAAAEVSAGIDLRGAGFDASCVASFGDSSATSSTWVSESRLWVQVPADLSPGRAYDVAVTCGDDSDVLVDAFWVLAAAGEAFSLRGVVPPEGDAAGGDVISVAGDGLGDVNAVRIAGVDAAAFEVISERLVRVTTPPGAAGPAVIEVTSAAAGTSSLEGFAYTAGFTATALAPASGAMAGGTPVVLSGRGFGDGLAVTLGGLPAVDLVVLSDGSASFTTPPGSAGTVDVEVTLGDERRVLENGFRYEASLEVLGATPNRGGISGGTWVTVRGQGFTRGAPVAVSFGGQPATDVFVVSDSLLTLRTPLHEPGPVDIVVTVAGTQGAESAAAARAFTFFDPTYLLGGTRGGPIDGAVYVTVLDAFLGLPVPDLVVFLGTGGEATSHMALTNVLGQATISGPDVTGPQTVSVVADGWEYASLVDVNASEITLYLQPLATAPPSDGPPPPPPPPPPPGRGRVFGVAKEFFDPAALGPDELALAFVGATARDEFSRPGSSQGVVFNEGGEYFIQQSRPGRLALVALAGIYNTTTDEFRPRQMGVRRPVYLEMGDNAEEQDIELTIPLDEDVELSLPDAPVGLEEGPTITRVVPFLRFGGEGSLAYTTAVDTTRNHDLRAMPDVPGEMLTFIAGAYTTDGQGLIDDVGTLGLVEGESLAFGTGTTWAAVDPFTGLPLVLGGILVVEAADGQRWATEVVNALDNTTLVLGRKAPFSTTAAAYHIGEPTFPSSVVQQDGVGDLIGGVLINPVLGLPEPLSPLDDGVLENRMLRWKAALGQQPTNHLIYVYDPFEFSTLWTFYIDGSRTKVPIPRIPANVGDLPIGTLPEEPKIGGYFWQHMSMFVPGYNYENWSYLDIGSRARRSWTTNVTSFVYGGD